MALFRLVVTCLLWTLVAAAHEHNVDEDRGLDENSSTHVASGLGDKLSTTGHQTTTSDSDKAIVDVKPTATLPEAPSVIPTSKVDLKKDSKKKNKPLFKKKDKILDEDMESGKMAETTAEMESPTTHSNTKTTTTSTIEDRNKEESRSETAADVISEDTRKDTTTLPTTMTSAGTMETNPVVSETNKALLTETTTVIDEENGTTSPFTTTTQTTAMTQGSSTQTTAEDAMTTTQTTGIPEEHSETLTTASETDSNTLNNNLDTETATSVIDLMSTQSNRQEKQLNLDKEHNKCSCNDPNVSLNPVTCKGLRTVPDPSCPCRNTCARQSGEACSDKEPCDEEFGLRCNTQNNTCHGPLSLDVFEVTHNSAKARWSNNKSELQPQALVFYSSSFRGPHTQWTKYNVPTAGMHLEGLLSGQAYFIKVEEDGKQEIVPFKTKDNIAANMPKILVKQKTQTTLTVVWDDFRLPSYHSEYILEYKPSDDNQNWTKVQAGTQTIVTVTHLRPNTPYEVKVAVWEHNKLELPSEVITAYTADGCVQENKVYNVGEEYFIGCDSRCVCQSNNQTSCSPRCNSPYVKVGSYSPDPLCYEKPIPSDLCCVTIRCSETKYTAGDEDARNKSGECPEVREDSEMEGKLCMSDCDHDGNCSGDMKCCPSACGGAVCKLPMAHEDACEHIYCGPNAACVSEKMACVCSPGYEGNPHDFLNGCLLSNSTNTTTNGNQERRSRLEDGLPHDHSPEMNHYNSSIMIDKSRNPEFKNELETEAKDKKEIFPTEAPFQLDLTHLNNTPIVTIGSENATITSGTPNDEENTHLSRPQDTASRDKSHGAAEKEDMDHGAGKDIPDVPTPFEGCEYNNITYDRGEAFEDGCDARCTCDGNGHVSCVPRCTLLSAGAPSCREIPDPDDECCKIMVCSFPGSADKDNVESLPLKILSALAQNGTAVRVRVGLSMSKPPTMVGRDVLEVWYRESSDNDNDLSQWNKKLVNPNQLTEVSHGVFEFDINELMPNTDYFIKVGKDSQGATDFNIGEFSNTVNVKTFPAAVKMAFQGCFHHNQSYSLGEVFYQGCEHKCICREKGFIECQERCEIYIDTIGYEGCDWVQSEEDPCCTIPMCNRRKIPLMPDGRQPFNGNSENICIVDTDEVYRVGDIWESGDGCKTKICRCTLLANGSTSVQCQSECPPLAPNAHIPTARCPHPQLIKPDGPCSCPYVVCNDAPPRRVIQPPRPQCEYKGHRYDMGHEFHDGCISHCHCGQDLRVNCAAIECPYHFSAEFTNCLEWDIDPNFFPTPPHCCAPAKCRNDGSCMFSGQKFGNFKNIPEELLPCGTRCVCVNGNVTCENRCQAIEDVPPSNMPCSPNFAYKGHVEGETCCLQWMCQEPMKQSYCMFQGSRYLVSEQWEVQKGSHVRLCTCQMNDHGIAEVECRGGCPQIPQRFLLPTEQCLKPVIVNPDDPLMCPYVVCNNTVTVQELHNVNVVALNSTAVRVRFTLSHIMVGLVGHAELYFTTDPTLPSNQWHVQKFSRPKRLFDSQNIEYVLNALRPNTTYFFQVKIKVDALQGGPESEVFKLKLPEDVAPTTTVPPMIIIDPKAEAHVIDAKTVRITWRNFEQQEKKYIYALQLKYKMERETDDKWITTPMIHRDVNSYFLHDLGPSSNYMVDFLFIPPKDVSTKMVSAKGVDFQTSAKIKEEYHLHVAVEDNMLGPDKSSFSFAGIPEPITKHVHVIKIMYKSTDGERSYSFKVPKSNHVMLDHLKPGKRYLAQLELYLTNGQTLTSNEVEFITKAAKIDLNASASENVISREPNLSGVNGKSAELLQSKATEQHIEEENRAYFIALVVVAVVAAVAAFGFVLLLVLLVRRQASAKAPISRTPSESAYDNPTYKTYDGERPEDKTNGQMIQTTQT